MMRARTVEQQQIRLAEQGPRQRQPHAPPTGERPRGVPLTLRVEAEAGQDAGGARLGLVRVHLRQLGVHVAQRRVQRLALLVQPLRVAGAVGERGPLGLDAGELLGDFLGGGK